MDLDKAVVSYTPRIECVSIKVEVKNLIVFVDTIQISNRFTSIQPPDYAIGLIVETTGETLRSNRDAVVESLEGIIRQTLYSGDRVTRLIASLLKSVDTF